MSSPRTITTPVLVAFGKRVRTLRRAAGLTQTKLGERAYIGQQFVCRIERRQGNPSLATIALIAAALNCSIADLFSRSTD